MTLHRPGKVFTSLYHILLFLSLCMDSIIFCSVQEPKTEKIQASIFGMRADQDLERHLVAVLGTKCLGLLLYTSVAMLLL